MRMQGERRVEATCGDGMPFDHPAVYTRSSYARVRSARRMGPSWTRSAALAIEHRRVSRNASRGSPVGTRILILLLLIPVIAIVVLGGTFGLAATAAVAVLSADLPDPSTLNTLTYAQPTVVYDRTGQVQLGVFQQERRRVVAYDDVPKLVLDADDDRRGPIVLGQRRLRPGRDPRRRRRERQRRERSRRIDDHPAARPGPTPAAQRHRRRGRPLHPQGEGADPVVAPDRRVPGRGRQGTDHLGLPQPDLLRPRRLRDRRGRRDLLRGHRPLEADAGPGGPPRRPAEVALDARSVPLRGAGRRRQARRPAGLAAGRPPRLHPREPLDLALDEPLRAAAPRSPRRAGRPRRRPAALVPRAALHVAGPAAARGDPRRRCAADRDRRLPGHHVAQLGHAGAGGALAQRRGPRPEPQERRRRADARAPEDPVQRPALDQRPPGQGPPQRVARGARLQDRRCHRLRRAAPATTRRASPRRKFEPKYDVAGDGERQPGSAWKPILYASAFDTGALTPGSLLLDITTEFDQRQNWAPRDADQLDRGPVLVRKALQYSLNVPAIRALQRVGNEAVADRAEAMGIRFKGGKEAFLQSGLAGAIGTVEVRPLDLTAAYGAIANWGQAIPPRMILEVRDAGGQRRSTRRRDPKPVQTVSSQAASLVTSILAGQHRTAPEPDLGGRARDPQRPERRASAGGGQDRHGARCARPRHLRLSRRPGGPVATGPRGRDLDGQQRSLEPVLVEARDLADRRGAAVAGVRPRRDERHAARPLLDAQGRSRRRRSTRGPAAGRAPGPGSASTRCSSTARSRARSNAIDPDGLLYSRACGGWRVDPLKAELGPSAWDVDVADWLRRARRGLGVEGRLDSRTAYFWGKSLVGRLADRGVPEAEAGAGEEGQGEAAQGTARPAAAARAPVPNLLRSRDPMSGLGPWIGRGAAMAIGVAIVIGVLAFAWAAGTVLVLMFVAVILGAALEPVVGWLRHTLPIGRGAAILLVYGMFLASVIALAFVVVPLAIDQFGEIVAALPQFLDQAREWAATLRPRGAVAGGHVRRGPRRAIPPDRCTRRRGDRRGRSHGRGRRHVAADAADRRLLLAHRARPPAALRAGLHPGAPPGAGARRLEPGGVAAGALGPRPADPHGSARDRDRDRVHAARRPGGGAARAAGGPGRGDPDRRVRSSGRSRRSSWRRRSRPSWP